MATRTRSTTLAAITAAVALAASACGSDEPAVGGPIGTSATTLGTVPTTVPTTVPAAGGWIGGEPAWSGADEYADGGELREYGAVTEERASDAVEADIAGGDVAPVHVEADVAGGGVAPIPVEPDGGIGDGAEPLPPDIEPPVDRPLRAGSVDDNADYQGFLDYLSRIADLGIALRPLDPANRSVVRVTGANGLPVSGAEVVATAGGASVSMRTTADGTVRFHPGFYAIDVAGGVTFAVEGAEDVTVGAGEDASIVVTQDGGAAAPVPLDVLFLLDATGSMGDEIDRLKSTIDTVASQVAALDPAPDVRFGMTLYRDDGDAFVTASYDFTSDVGEFRAALRDVVAEGGGDYPEALEEGLAEALSAPSWRPASDAVQLVFVVADAPPQLGRQVDVTYPDSIRLAVERGVKIFPVASSESDDQAEAVFRQLAQATGAPFVFLSYGAGGAATGSSTDIQPTDYEELALDALVVRLIAEELSALGDGPPVTAPPTTAPPTTNPEGQ